jgi:hypothetical protein
LLSKSSVRTVPIGVAGELIRGDAFYRGQLIAGAFLGSILLLGLSAVGYAAAVGF